MKMLTGSSHIFHCSTLQFTDQNKNFQSLV